MYMDSNNLFQQAGLTENQNDITFEQQKKIIATLQIELGQDETVMLEVKEFDDPYLVAVNFCKEHQLNEKAVEIIEKKVQEAIIKSNDKLNRKELQSRDSSTKKKAEYSAKTQVSPSKSINNNKWHRNKTGEQIGIKLYEKGIKYHQRLQDQRNKRKLEQQKQLEQQLTFKPKINQVSEKIVQYRKYYGKQKQKKNSSPPKKIYDELEECTFKPRINKVSQKIVRYKNRQEQDRIQELYYDSVRLAEKKKSINQRQQFTYKPSINPRSNQVVKQSFLDRLEKAIQKRRTNQIINYKKSQIECSFVPKIGRAPKIERNKENLPIGQYLQSVSCTKIRSSLQNSDYRQKETNFKNKHSQNLYNNLVDQKINELFEMLDGDKDGLISPDKVDIQQLSANTLRFLRPLFKELEDIDGVLDQRLFRKAMLRLIESSDINSRGMFLAEKREKQLQENFTFTPEINTKSKKILFDNQRSKHDLYQQGVRNRKKLQTKIQKQKARLQQKQLQECTFKPLLNSSSQIYIKKAMQQRTNRKFNLTDY